MNASKEYQDQSQYQIGFDAGYDFCLNEVKLFGARSINGTQELVQHLKNNTEESSLHRFLDTLPKRPKSYGNKK